MNGEEGVYIGSREIKGRVEGKTVVGKWEKVELIDVGYVWCAYELKGLCVGSWPTLLPAALPCDANGLFGFYKTLTHSLFNYSFHFLLFSLTFKFILFCNIGNPPTALGVILIYYFLLLEFLPDSTNTIWVVINTIF